MSCTSRGRSPNKWLPSQILSFMSVWSKCTLEFAFINYFFCSVLNVLRLERGQSLKSFWAFLYVYIWTHKDYVPNHWVKVLFTCQTALHHEILNSFYNKDYEWFHVYVWGPVLQHYSLTLCHVQCGSCNVVGRFVIPKCYFLFLKLYGESLSGSHNQAKENLRKTVKWSL